MTVVGQEDPPPSLCAFFWQGAKCNKPVVHYRHVCNSGHTKGHKPVLYCHAFVPAPKGEENG